MHDMLKIEIVEYLPIARSTVGQNTQLDFITNIQSQNNITDRISGTSTQRSKN